MIETHIENKLNKKYRLVWDTLYIEQINSYMPFRQYNGCFFFFYLIFLHFILHIKSLIIIIQQFLFTLVTSWRKTY